MNMPDDSQNTPQVAKLKMSYWLNKNYNFHAHPYLDLYQLPLPTPDNSHGPRPKRVWMIVAATIRGKDYLVDMDIVVLRKLGSARIVNDFTAAEHAGLKALDPFLVGLTTRSQQ